MEEEDYHATEIESPNFYGYYDGVNEGNDKLYQSCFVKQHRLSTQLKDTSKFGSESNHPYNFNSERNEFSHGINSDNTS